MSTNTIDSVGIDSDRIARLKTAVEMDIKRERYDGAVIIVARRGQTVFSDAMGFTERATGRRARMDDFFPIMSLTKPLAAVLLLSRVERGDFQLTTQVAEHNNLGRYRFVTTTPPAIIGNTRHPDRKSVV